MMTCSARRSGFSWWRHYAARARAGGLLEELGADVVRLQADVGAFSPDDPEGLSALTRSGHKKLGRTSASRWSRTARAFVLVDQDGAAPGRQPADRADGGDPPRGAPGRDHRDGFCHLIGRGAHYPEWGGVHYRFKRGHRNVIAEAMRLNDEDNRLPDRH
jgi:hypothetical protein